MMNNKEIKYYCKLLLSSKSNDELFIGVIANLILSKQIFKKNTELSIFIKEVFNISFLPYVIRSRTLIMARIIKHAINLSEIEKESSTRRVVQYLYKLEAANLESNSNIIQKSKPKKPNSLHFMDKWISGIMNSKDDNAK